MIAEAPPPPVPPPPPGPAKLGADFALEASIVEVELQGGISTKQLENALARALGPVRECLRNVIAERGVATKGKVKVKGRIGSRGRFMALEAKGGAPGTAECAETHFKSARLPSADTGDVYVDFAVHYRAE